MNCRDTEELLGAYCEGAIAPSQRQELEAHLRDCPVCTAELRAWRGANALRLGPTAPRAGRWPLVLLAAAACVAAFMALGTGSQPGHPQTDLAREVVGAHVRSLQANHLLDIASPDRFAVRQWYAGKLDFAPDVTPPAGFELLGGRLDYLDGRNVAAFIFRYRQHTINLFTWPARQNEEGPEPQSARGFHMLHWAAGGMNWWAVSDLGGAELRRTVHP